MVTVDVLLPYPMMCWDTDVLATHAIAFDDHGEKGVIATDETFSYGVGTFLPCNERVVLRYAGLE